MLFYLGPRELNSVRILVTGGAGFIGSNFIHYILAAHPDWEITLPTPATWRT